MSSTPNAVRYELEARVTFNSGYRSPYGILQEITAIVKRLPGGTASGGSTPFNRGLTSGVPITQTWTQQFDMRAADQSAVWIVSAKGQTHAGQAFGAGPLEVGVELNGAPNARGDLQFFMPPARRRSGRS